MQLLIILLTFSICVQPQSGVLVGGFVSAQTSGLDEYQQDVDNFIRKNVAQTSNAIIIGLRQQVVAGIKYCFTYSVLNNQQICVWSKPWQDNFLQMVAPDGKTYTRRGNVVTVE